MIWVLTGAVTLSIILFFVYMFKVRPRALESHAALEVPSDETITLPAGEIGVYYEDSHRWSYANRPQVGAGFSVLISDESGGRVDLAEPGSELIIKAGGKNRIPYGRLSLGQAGSYRVVSQINDGVEKPRVTFGKAP